MPTNISIGPSTDSGAITLPSAQSIIWSSGNFALYIAVVLHHIGKPKNNTIAQKENITKALSRMLSGVSGGGSFFVGATDTAFAGASSPFSILPSLTPASDIAGAVEDADMAMLLFVTSGSGQVTQLRDPCRILQAEIILRPGRIFERCW